MRHIIAVSFVAAFLAAFFYAAPALAQTMCGERSAVVASLEKTYSETPVSMGLARNGAVIEILASPSGSFTIILTLPDGLSCVMAAGENWENMPGRLAGTKIAYGPWAVPSKWHPGTIVGFHGFCRDMGDIFRLARILNAGAWGVALAFYESPRNSCVNSVAPRFGIMREKVSARYAIDGEAHIWRVDMAGDGPVFVIVGETPPARREA